MTAHLEKVIRKIIKVVAATLFSVFLTFIFFGDRDQVVFALTRDRDDNQDLDNQSLKKDINLDELLGPDQNFPFLPDNHRDGSNPIGRIGKIKD